MRRTAGTTGPALAGNSRVMQALPIAAVLIVMTVALYAGRDQLTGAITGERLGSPEHNSRRHPLVTPGSGSQQHDLRWATSVESTALQQKCHWQQQLCVLLKSPQELAAPPDEPFPSVPSLCRHSIGVLHSFSGVLYGSTCIMAVLQRCAGLRSPLPGLA